MPSYLSPGVYVEETPSLARPIAGVGTSTAAFLGVYTDGTPPENQPVLCTSFTDFTRAFGVDFPKLPAGGKKILAQAVYGFFNNGGTRCWVVRVNAPGTTSAEEEPAKKGTRATRAAGASPNLGPALTALEAIDEVAIVAAPGCTDAASQSAILTHCTKTQDRVAVLDAPESATDVTFQVENTTPRPATNTYGAYYFPWIQVFDPDPEATGPMAVPPSGHIAGIYARVDAQRGVHKAPANEPILGALGVTFPVSRAQQDGLNPLGVNCLRTVGGAIRVWGARTIGKSDDTGDFCYISTRRFFNFLRESIDEGTQFVVFEPNSPALWQRITRTVSDFLLNQWRAGALFGETPKQAFFVKCDAETNPSSERELGRVITEIGVAIVKPAEFVIFRIQQITGG